MELDANCLWRKSMRKLDTSLRGDLLYMKVAIPSPCIRVDLIKLPVVDILVDGL